jgi:hypothetical protein
MGECAEGGQSAGYGLAHEDPDLVVPKDKRVVKQFGPLSPNHGKPVPIIKDMAAQCAAILRDFGREAAEQYLARQCRRMEKKRSKDASRT